MKKLDIIYVMFCYLLVDIKTNCIFIKEIKTRSQKGYKKQNIYFTAFFPSLV